MDGTNWVRKRNTWAMRRGSYMLEVKYTGDCYDWSVAQGDKLSGRGTNQTHTPTAAKKAAYEAYLGLSGEEYGRKSEG